MMLMTIVLWYCELFGIGFLAIDGAHLLSIRGIASMEINLYSNIGHAHVNILTLGDCIRVYISDHGVGDMPFVSLLMVVGVDVGVGVIDKLYNTKAICPTVRSLTLANSQLILR